MDKILQDKSKSWWTEDSLVRFQNSSSPNLQTPWSDIEHNINKMDSLYDATFHSWLKTESNVPIVSSYLHRIANNYPLDRIINAVKWLVSSWKLESISQVIRKISADWASPPPDSPSKHAFIIAAETKRGIFVREVTRDWSCIQVARLISILSSTFWKHRLHQESFLKALVLDWDFLRLSEFFSYIGAHLGLDYRLKVSMLQFAARRNSKNSKQEPQNKDPHKRLAHQPVEPDPSKRPRLNPDPNLIQNLPYIAPTDIQAPQTPTSQLQSDLPQSILPETSPLTCQLTPPDQSLFDISQQQPPQHEISIKPSTSSNNLKLN
ncbi:hypothetical protein BB559_002926 [Furculomyces boomerangus]|uniref:Uncharacterized protein n=2 Tax=Harpellales TaxID=61421 RepID=A0A2T9YR57_9FUNG|nr:hypothetical protein BB559_002926 [Furculomyces boomerangus]PWA01222.1 hypothetical protein BB558_002706 [Smittium angustum]